MYLAVPTPTFFQGFLCTRVAIKALERTAMGGRNDHFLSLSVVFVFREPMGGISVSRLLKKDAKEPDGQWPEPTQRAWAIRLSLEDIHCPFNAHCRVSQRFCPLFCIFVANQVSY